MDRGSYKQKTWIKSPSQLLKQKLQTSLNIYIFNDMEFKHDLTKMFKFMKKKNVKLKKKNFSLYLKEIKSLLYLS